jgi:3D (Asp-Asp-Asp) domain-containing protein
MKSILIILIATFVGDSAFAACQGNIATTTLYNMDGLGRQGCKTGRGQSGNCIIPYVSIAADTEFNRSGTIIFLPAMRGKVVRLSNGQKKKHPGFFIIDDTGSAVVGHNKFDFFVGDPKVEKSSFSNDALPEMALKGPEQCIDTKKFQKIAKYKNAKDKKNDVINPKYKAAVKQMEDFWKAAKVKRPDLEEVIEKGSPTPPKEGSGVY